MINAKLITSLIKGNPSLLGQSIELRPGQILKGTVLKLLPENMALVQLKGVKVTAELNVNLNEGDKVWLQVHSNGEPITLKVLAQNQGFKNAVPLPQNLSSLASSLGLPRSEAVTHMLSQFISRQIPIEKTLVEQALHWTEQTGTGPKEMELFFIAVNKGLPVRSKVLASLKEVLYGPPLIKLVQDLKQELNSLQKFSHTSIELEKQVGEWSNLVDSILMEMSQDSQITGSKLKEQLKNLGLMWERQLHESSSFMEEKNLKRVLYALEDRLTKIPERSNLAAIVDKLTNHLIGQQMLMAPSPSLMEQLVIQIPFSFLGDKSSFVQIEGKKQEKGGLDPDYCRLLFLLHLQTLGETFVNLTVTNRIVSMQILGNHPELEERAKSLYTELSEGMKKEGFHLSAFRIGGINCESSQQKNVGNLFAKQKGLDVRI